MPVLAVMFKLALELYNKCRGSSFALLHPYLVANIATDEKSFFKWKFIKNAVQLPVSFIFQYNFFYLFKQIEIRCLLYPNEPSISDYISLFFLK